jgi:hypothetical protein
MKRLLLLLLFSPLVFSACTKEGPAGPEGPQGTQGPQGPQGVAGPQGQAGNANVQVYEKDISAMTWTAAGTYSYLNIVAPNVLTASVLANNTILVYVYTSDFGGWGQVPYATERNIRVTAEIGSGYVRLTKDQNGSPTTQSWHHKIRLVIIKNTGAAAQLNRTAIDNYPAEKIVELN